MSEAAFCRFVGDYDALLDTFRERSEQMALSRLELDRIAGLTSGHAGKLLSRRRIKNFGPATLGPVLQTLGLILVAVEDPAARERTLARREPFSACNRRPGNENALKRPAEPSDAPAPASPVMPNSIPPITATHSHLRVIQARPGNRRTLP